MQLSRSRAVGFLAAQAVAGGVWWLSLVLWPASRQRYWPSGWPETGLLAFWLPDLMLFAGGSAASAWLLAAGRPGRKATLWVTAGATAYAALYCVSLWLMTGEAFAALAAMVPCALVTVAIASQHG